MYFCIFRCYVLNAFPNVLFRKNASLFDVSHMCSVKWTGKDAEGMDVTKVEIHLLNHSGIFLVFCCVSSTYSCELTAQLFWSMSLLPISRTFR